MKFGLLFALLVGSALASDQIVFPKATIKVDGHSIHVELARTEEQLSRGLMFRQKLADDAGMLFIFKDESIRHFWMKNTFIPLAIGFFDKEKRLVDFQEMQPVKSEMQTDIPQIRKSQTRHVRFRIAKRMV